MKVLVIEDDTAVRKALKRGFQSKMAVAEFASDGKEALTMVASKNYDVLVIDLMLPHINGELIVEKVRAVGIKTPILVLTALRKPETKARLLNLGADDFLEKPFAFDELYARIAAIMRRMNRGALTQKITLGDLELIPEKRIAIRCGKQIPLRGKEYNLLEYCMQHPDQILSYQKLMENVWGYSAGILSNTVASHISSLRRKIDRDYETNFIETVHGIGYMFYSKPVEK